MTTFSSRIATRGTAVRDLAAVWIVVTAVLTYLDVPLQHAPLFAINLVLQASLGVAVITYLLKGVAPSLLLLCGPGLILGGALSFAIFQVVGRGVIGLVTTIAVGIAATTHLLVSREPYDTFAPRWWLLGQLVGMAMLVLTSEFEELLPLSLLFFLLGISLRLTRTLGRLGKFALIVISLFILTTSFLLRSEHWWVVTDDYLLLEVIKRHLTIEGPFANWGATDFSKYHWLSYGWAGLLDLASGTPDPLVGLTRVMPFFYSVSLSSTLLLLWRQGQHQPSNHVSTIAVWAVVGVGRFDWAGTSTAGIYAVISVMAFLLVIGSKQQRSPGFAIAMLVVFVILALTKFPSIFAALLISIFSFTHRVPPSAKYSRKNAVFRILGYLLALPAVLTTIWLSSKLVGGRFAYIRVNPQIGQLAVLGGPLAGLVLVLNQIWLGLPLTALAISRGTRNSLALAGVLWVLPAIVLSWVAGIFLDVSITANADNHKYFSGPMYFIASLSLLFVISSRKHAATTSRDDAGYCRLTSLGLTLAGLLWSLANWNQVFWDALAEHVIRTPNLGLELLKFFTSDGRFAVSVLGVLVLLIASRRDEVVTATKSVVLSLVFVSFASYVTPSFMSFQREISPEELMVSVGSTAERAVGVWLAQNTDSNDLIATNHLFGPSGGGVQDMGLAVWSQREFLVLGPGLGNESTQARTEAIALSMAFADDPSEFNCERLLELGVEFFIVDLGKTQTRSWSKCSGQLHEISNFVILQLRNSDSPN